MKSSKSFTASLTDRAEQVDSLLCIGLDPHPEFLDEPSAIGLRDFCLRLIDSTAQFACAFKPNSAFFEAYGAPGWTALREVIAAVPEGIPVILDAKRGDIASTARAYAQAAFGWLGADAVTVNPYLGHDAVEPFLEDPGRGVFLLCKTSNPGAGDLQSLSLDGEALYLKVARLAIAWNTAGNLGLVVGATDPQALASVRELAPELWILAPGVGPQGGDLAAAVRAGLREDRLGLVVPVSRALMTAGTPADAARRLRDQLNEARAELSRHRPRPAAAPTPSAAMAGSTANDSGSTADIRARLTGKAAALADALLESGCVRLGDFELKSGGRSPIYFDLRRVVGSPELLSRVASSYLPLLAGLRFDRLAAVPYAGLPIATAVSLQSGHPLVYPRKETKGYGTGAAVEGGFEPGESVVVLDDVATTAASKFEAIERLTAAGLIVRDAVVLIDREGGARHALAQAGYTLHAVFTLSQLLDHWELTGAVGVDDVANMREYMAREQG
jgi:uridine monophosphate synthetase